MNAQTERLTLAGPAGAIEALRDLPVPSAAAQVPDLLSADPNAAPGQESPEPRGTAIICHPHPLFGGTMDNKVVQTLARALVQCGWTAVRFNFRGVGASAGSYDEGRGEADDCLAVVQQVAPTGPVVIAGFSFGAFVAAQTVGKLMPQRPPEAVVLVGTAASRFEVPPIADALHGRTLVVHGEHDDTVPLAAVMDWARPQLLPVTVVPGGGHFFHGQLGLLKGLVVRHLLAH